MAFLEIDRLSAFYGKARALHGVNIAIEAGEIVAIIGANGAGKSTLLDSIIGLTSITGDVRLDGESLVGLTSRTIVERGVGYAPERFNLFPYMTVLDNLMVGAFTARDDAARNLDLVFDLFPRLAERRDQETYTQSGGERQMVSLGRALMTNPRLLLVDEPTIGLAPKVCLDIADALRRLNQETGLTILITEQNANFAMSLASQIHILETGEIRMSGSVEELGADADLKEAYFGH